MDTASASGFLRTLLIIVLVYYAFKFIMRYLVPLLVFRVVKKAGNNFQQQQQRRQEDFYNKQNNTSQQETKADFSRPDTLREKKKIGEYIEYEELD